MPEQQTYANHTRWYTLFHFVVMPILAINLLSHIVRFIMAPSVNLGFWVLLSFVLILIALASRLMALKAQDRVIRLEERLRYKDVLSAELAARASDLPVGQIIALRFASDGELPDLVSQVLDGKLTSTKDIKMAVKTWRPDYLRV
jgi:Family of unknown function (DUF6526)